MAVVAVVGNGMAGTPGHRGPRLLGPGRGRRQRDRHRPGLLGAEHLVRGGGGRAPRRPRGASTRAFQLSKIGGGRVAGGARAPTWCCSASGASAAPSPTSSLRRNGASRRTRGGPASTARATSSTRAGSRGPACCGWPGARTRARCWRRWAAQRPRPPTALAFIASHAVSRPGARGRDRRGDGRPAAPRPSATASTSCSPTRSRWPAPPQSYARLLDAAAAAGRRIRYEATVGAGLPIIDTYLKLVESGDRVLRDRRLRERHARLRAVGGLGRPAVLARRCARRWTAATPSPIHARTSRAGTRPARGSSSRACSDTRAPPPAAEDLVPRALRRAAASPSS